jgi:hypothetical protein
MELQRRLPNARIMYVSATGASEAENLCYMERLGLWGPGSAFPSKQGAYGSSTVVDVHINQACGAPCALVFPIVLLRVPPVLSVVLSRLCLCHMHIVGEAAETGKAGALVYAAVFLSVPPVLSTVLCQLPSVLPAQNL